MQRNTSGSTQSRNAGTGIGNDHLNESTACNDFRNSNADISCLPYINFKKLGPIYRKMQRTLDRVNSIVQENLTAIRTVKSYVKGEYECGKFSKVNKEFKESSEEAFHYAVMNMPCFCLSCILPLSAYCGSEETSLIWEQCRLEN